MSGKEKIAIAILALVLALIAAMIIDAVIPDVKLIPCKAPVETSWAPPNVQLCPEEIGLWECIRTVAYREDI